MEMINPTRESKDLPYVHIGVQYLSDFKNYTQTFAVISEERVTGRKGNSSDTFTLVPILLLKFIH